MDKKELTYDEAMAEIEAILAKFRNEEMSVDALAAEVRRATTLIAFGPEKEGIGSDCNPPDTGHQMLWCLYPRSENGKSRYLSC